MRTWQILLAGAVAVAGLVLAEPYTRAEPICDILCKQIKINKVCSDSTCVVYGQSTCAQCPGDGSSNCTKPQQGDTCTSTDTNISVNYYPSCTSVCDCTKSDGMMYTSVEAKSPTGGAKAGTTPLKTCAVP
ncbi:MAG: hypothetical protein K2X87_00840 [Gemmataceae bacterium]|nr:hypothetical protein [Gemmataceae bacterium]